ncbi:MAG: arginine--tRNA ligase, partial [Anaerolineaceae bacterium]|nr:arginine--tRNA ligase [Anaerolineaceae bacterium]
KLISSIVENAIRKSQESGKLPNFEVPPVPIQKPKVNTYGDYATGVCLNIARLVKMAPMAIAQIVVSNIPQNDVLGETHIASPGFINFHLDQTWLVHQVEAIVSEGEEWGSIDIGQGERVQVEFVSANPTGPLTVGSARNAVFGDTLARLFEAAGFSVHREYYINDLGSKVRKMGKTLYWHYSQALEIDESMPDEHYPGVFLEQMGEDLAQEFGDIYRNMPSEEAVKELGEIGTERTLEEIKDSLALINIGFDNWFSERSLYSSGTFDKVFQKLDQKGYLYQKDGATWFSASMFGLEQDAVVVRSAEIIPNFEDRPTYLASDIAYVWNKLVDRGFSKAFYVWGADHLGDKPRVLAATEALDLDPNRVVIILYQLVTLFRGGEEIRMSKSSGEFVTMRDVTNEVGSDALRFVLLSSSHDHNIKFDFDLVVRQSNENLVYYVQYAHARICSILKKATQEGWNLGKDGIDLTPLHAPAELALISKMLELPEIIERSVKAQSPHYLTQYAQDLASKFHSFYRDCRVINEDPKNYELSTARLNLVLAAKYILARTLHLMGMEAPETM